MKNIQYGTEFLDQLKDKVHEQQWEIEKLNNIIKELDKLGVKVGRLNIDLINRIDKAIQYIEDELFPNGSNCVNGSDLPYEPIQKLLKILRGEEK